MYDITASIATYKNEPGIIRRAAGSFFNTALHIKLYIIDNSPTDEIAAVCCGNKRVEYILNHKNLGFGAAHNIAIRKTREESKYHLVLNPDIFFESGVLEKLFNFMEKDNSIGVAMPKICYPDGSTQYLCKLLPSPFDLILRRLNLKILNAIFKKRLGDYELRFTGYDRIMDVPHLSGCFMFLRREVFAKVGFFDERFFMYLEDVDFSRRIHKYYRTVYYPEVCIYHGYAKGSYNNLIVFMHHTLSAIKYFNKWGWFFDKERAQINNKIFNNLKNLSLQSSNPNKVFT